MTARLRAVGQGRKQFANAGLIAVGYGVGADLSVFFSRHVGVGWLVRYNRASSTIELPDDGFFATVLEQTGVTTDVKFGGANVAGGLRFRF